ncbi:MAG: glycosyltransferase [Methylococcales bacterium]|nr:glycosyltransferase [Methylococcales bacterium]
MKILHYISAFSLPSETFIYDLINNLEDNGSDNYILTHNRQLEDERPFSKVKVIYEKVSFLKKVYFKLVDNWGVRNKKDVLAYIDKLKPDVIHAHFGTNGVKIYRLLQMLNLNIPLVISFHGTDTTMYPLQYKKYKKIVQSISNDERVVFSFPSEFLKLEFQKNFVLKNNTNQIVLPNSYNKNFNAENKKYFQNNKALKLISIGRLISVKGFQYLIHAVKILKKDLPNIELKIVGSGSEMYSLQLLIEQLSLNNEIKLIGVVKHNEISSLLCESDIYIQPSIVDKKTNQTESFGVAVVEAITSGLPVIVTDVGGLPGTVLGGCEFAKIIEPDNAKSIVDAVLEMARNCSDNIVFRNKIEDKYSQNKQLSNLLEIYKQGKKRKVKKIYNSVNFDSKSYWEERYRNGGNSGAGSYNAKAEYKANILNKIIEKYKINKLIEFGCGDGNNLRYYNIEYYTGIDVSKTAIDICISKYKNDKKKSFLYYEPSLFKSGGLKVTLTISFEVIFHLIEDDVFELYLYNLFDTSSKYVLVCSSNDNNMDDSANHVKHRKFTDSIPKEFKLVDEIITPQEGELKGFFSNFYLFKRVT